MPDIVNLMLTVAGPGAGGFLGSWIGFYIWCPNRGCCRMKNVHRVCEDDQGGVR
jgi:hypothetical protein